ncbi:MAG: hypothetical protein Q9174_000856 [Haloplaca sp. 1 TL-2023]
MGSPTNAPEFIDDIFTSVILPFPMQMGQNSSNEVFVTSNGVLELFSGTWQYSNIPLPAAILSPWSACAFWDDTVVSAGRPQGIFYQVDGTQVIFEYYLSHYQAEGEYYHWLVSYNANQPGIFTFTYYQISDLGRSATVGIQYGPDLALQYSHNQPIITPGLVLIFDTIRGTLTPGSASTC